MPCGSCCSYVFMYMFCKINDHNVKFWHDFFVKMWFKVHRNVNDIREQIIAFIKKHIIILFTHKSIHNSDRKGIKYRMPYPRWSTSLVVNKQNKLCFFFKKIFWFPMFWLDYGFLLRSEKKFRTSQELKYFLFVAQCANFFFQNLTSGYMTKTLNQIIFFSSTKIRTLGIRIFF
jgi:hypothetical protein